MLFHKRAADDGRRATLLRLIALGIGLCALGSQSAAAQRPDKDYTVLVASEAVDLITRSTFGPVSCGHGIVYGSPG